MTGKLVEKKTYLFTFAPLEEGALYRLLLIQINEPIKIKIEIKNQFI